MKSFNLAGILNQAVAKTPLLYNGPSSTPPGPLPNDPGPCSSCLNLTHGFLPHLNPDDICPPGPNGSGVTSNPPQVVWDTYMTIYDSINVCPVGDRLLKALAANDNPSNPHMPLVPASTLKRCLTMDFSKYNNPATICGKATPICRCCNYKVVNGNWVLETTGGTVDKSGPCLNFD